GATRRCRWRPCSPIRSARRSTRIRAAVRSAAISARRFRPRRRTPIRISERRNMLGRIRSGDGCSKVVALSVLALVVAGPAPARGQTQTPNGNGGPAAYDTSAFAALRWREIGPFRGGRSATVAGSAARPNEYYMGTTGGGVFKTTDGGETWNPVTDKYFGGTIGAIAVAPSNPDIVYVGTGEYDIRGNVSHGDGMFKSVDAGKTWQVAGL